ncbi:unnamed protein product [Mytilus coruscus]|uniref:C1q domain-containing protein n=1 Tax=Mytilus coruscus TaxID=42192 RepID=A0A6J8AAE6_MYTCO|nr:unnamed protein product [Mytilus coruscus]
MKSVATVTVTNKTAQLGYRVDVLQQTVHSMQVITAQIEHKQVMTENSSRNLEKDITGLIQITKCFRSPNDPGVAKQDYQYRNETKTNRKYVTITVLSVDAVGGTVLRYGVIPFKSVYTSHGIKNLTRLKTNGQFTCEDARTYLISVFLSTGSQVPGYFNIYVNTGSTAYAFTDYESYQHTSSAAIVTNLHKGDIVFIRNRPEITVQNNESHLSIIHIIQIR